MTTTTAHATYQFGTFELHPAARRLFCDGAPVSLAPRAFDLLVALVQNAGTLVTKDDLLKQVWPRVVVEENALQVQVSVLRKAIGQEAIATVSRHGYRFDMEVRKPPLARTDVSDSPPHNLPESPSTFIGRQTEIVQIKRQSEKSRLVSLIGAGGCGKTRLALQVAHELVSVFEDGVWLVELAPLSDPGLVPNALAGALGLGDKPGTALTQTIVSHLSSLHCLILLDNAEHLLPAVRTLARCLLLHCPEVRLIVTSRERLAVSNESSYRVPSLSVPDPQRDSTPARLAGFESTQLLVERIRLQRPHFAVTDENAGALASICQRLDGMPLAIELAASRVRAMSVEEIDQRLDRRFALLTGGPPTVRNRQRTLRATVDWSHDLLSAAEQALFRRLSVFAGGWSLLAAEEVCTDTLVTKDQVLDLLMSLADKSLILTEENLGDTRFSMLQTVREYASERLGQDETASEWHERCLDHFLRFAEDAAPQLTLANAELMQRLKAEHDNFRALVSAPGSPDKVLRLAAALFRFWWWGGYAGEGLSASLRVLEHECGAEHLRVRALVLKAAGVFAGIRGDFETSRSLHESALAIFRELDDKPSIASSLIGLGLTAFDQGLYASARAHQEEALAISRGLGDLDVVSKILCNLGNVAGEIGDFESADSLHRESLGLAREVNNQWTVAASLNSLSVIARYRGDLAAARTWCEQAVAICRVIGEPRATAITLGQLGSIVLEQGNFLDGAPMIEECLSELSRMGDRAAAMEAIGAVAEAMASVRPTDAARLWGAIQRQRELDGIRASPVAVARFKGRALQARAMLDDGMAFEKALEEGRSMSLPCAEQLAVLCLRDASHPAASPDGDAAGA